MENSQTKICPQPFYMVIEKILSNPQSPHTTVSGKIKSGELHPGDILDLLGFNEDTLVRCIAISTLKVIKDSAKEGDIVALRLQKINVPSKRFIGSNTIFRPIPGQVLATPKTIETSFNIIGKYRFLSKAEGGLDRVYPNKSTFLFGLNTTSIVGQILLPDNKTEIASGEEIKGILSLAFPIATQKGDQFNICQKGVIVGIGTVEETEVN